MNKKDESPQTDILIAQKEVLSFREAIVFLDVSKSFLYKMTSGKKIKTSKPNGGKLYFRKVDLINWMLQNKSDSIQERENELLKHLDKNSKSKKGGSNHGS